MKIRNILFYLFTLSSLAFRLTVCSEEKLQTIKNIMATMDEATAQKILHGFHKHQQSSNHDDDLSSLSSYGDATISYETDLNDIQPMPEQMHQYSSELHASLADFEFNLDGSVNNHRSTIQKILTTELSHEETKKYDQKKFRNDLISKSFGITAICAALKSGAIMTDFLDSHQKRMFGIDDAIIAKTIWTTVVPSLVTGITGFLAWRQVDYWLHAEERSRFTIIEHELKAFEASVKKDMAGELARRDRDLTTKLALKDKEATDRQKAIYVYVDRNIHTTETELKNQLEALSHHHKTQISSMQELLADATRENKEKLDDMTRESKEKNEETIRLINNALASSEKTHAELATMLTTVTNLKQNNSEMKVKLAEMGPVVQKVYLATQNIIQGQKTPTANIVVKKSTPQDLLATIHIPADDNDGDDASMVAQATPRNMLAQVNALSSSANSVFKKNNKKSNASTNITSIVAAQKSGIAPNASDPSNAAPQGHFLDFLNPLFHSQNTK